MNPHRFPLARSARHEPGFTLMELVLVMVLLCAVFAIVTPSLIGFRAATQFRDAGTQLVALTQWARAQSAADSRVYRLNVNAADGSYWLTAQAETGFEMVGTDFGRVFSLPPGARIAVERSAATLDGPNAAGGAAPADAIAFYPDGRCDVATIRLTDLNSSGETLVIACLSPAEPFRVVTAAEASGR